MAQRCMLRRVPRAACRQMPLGMSLVFFTAGRGKVAVGRGAVYAGAVAVGRG